MKLTYILGPHFTKESSPSAFQDCVQIPRVPLNLISYFSSESCCLCTDRPPGSESLSATLYSQAWKHLRLAQDCLIRCCLQPFLPSYVRFRGTWWGSAQSMSHGWFIANPTCSFSHPRSNHSWPSQGSAPSPSTLPQHLTSLSSLPIPHLPSLWNLFPVWK